MSKLVAIRIRGKVGVQKKVEDTLNMLRLKQKHVCCIVPDTPAFRGMMKKASHIVTWGLLDEETENLLVDKRGKKTTNAEGKTLAKRFFRLAPPKGGFERKGIKKPYSVGGALGYRGSKINELIKRMI
jgi:large subunit ribosomal protein L30